jgi:PAS domain S-box-containing protein
MLETSTPSNASKERVLLIDDEPQVLVALEDLLFERFLVLKTQSTDEALAIAAREKDLAVIITDQRMPRMTGDQLLSQLVTSSEACRILVTGFADLGAVSRAVNDGRIFAYVTKPWDPDDLLFKVQSAAEQFRLTHDLIKERQLLRDLMDNTPDGIYFKDEKLRILRANHSFARMLDQPDVASIVGKRLGELAPPPLHADEAEHEERRIIADGVAVTDVIRQYSFAGEQHFLSETKAAVQSPRADFVGLVGIARDVTRQRTLEAQLAQAQRLEAIGHFAGGVAHDFNNVLAVILSYAELTQSQLETDSTMYDDVAQIAGAAERGAALTRQLLAFSRRQFVEPRPIHPGEVVTNLEKMLRRLIGEDIALTVKTSSAGVVVADAGQMEQVVLNLVVNARDAMPRGGQLIIETTDVTLDESYTDEHEGMTPGPYVALTVTDAGTGMDAATIKRIFEPFFTTKEPGKGTGLGLATVYGIVKQSRGHIAVYSEMGRGTVFKVYLPRTDGEVASDAPGAEPTELPPANGRILLLEDDDAVRKVATRILRGHGYVVHECTRPSEARKICEALGSTLDLLVTDLVLPEMSGAELAQELGASFPHLRILFISGYPGTAAFETGLAFRQPYLEKPFTPRLLLAKVRDVLATTLSLLPKRSA